MVSGLGESCKLPAPTDMQLAISMGSCELLIIHDVTDGLWARRVLHTAITSCIAMPSQLDGLQSVVNEPHIDVWHQSA